MSNIPDVSTEPQETKSLIEILRSLNIHPLVGMKLFVKHAPIDEERFDLSKIPFHGHKIKIYRMGDNSNMNKWRVSIEIADLFLKIFFSLSSNIRKSIETKSKNLYELESLTKNNLDMQTNRLLFGLYEYQTVSIRARISKYCLLTDLRKPKLKVTFQNLHHPETEAVYADHTHVVLRESQVDVFTSLPIGTQLEFQATVHSYESRAEKKFGIHDLQDIRVVSSYIH